MWRTITPACGLLAALLVTATTAAAQDTVAEMAPVRITVGHPDVDGERLPHGRSTYLMELGAGDEMRRIGEYSVEIIRRAGGDERLIVQRTRVPDLQVVDSVLVRGRALTPVWYRMRSSRGRLDLRYEDGGRRVRGTEWTAEGETLAIDTIFAEARYPSTLAMVVVLALPLRAGYAAEMPLSRHGVGTRATARVAARERFEAAAGSHAAWRVEVASDGRPATRWIGVEDHHELATHTRVPNGSTFRQTRVDLTGSAAQARSHLRAAVDAMGGESLLRGLGAVRIETIAYVNLLEQSERPDGPYFVLFEESTELRDPANGRLRRTTRSRAPQRPGWGGQLTQVFDADVAAIIRGERTVPGRVVGLVGARESLALGPERLLLTALDAEDLHARADTTLQGVTHRVVAFIWRDRPVRIFLNAHTHLPTAVERTREHPLDQWSVWGDVTSRTLFSFWTLEENGLLYPHQWTVDRNGLRYRDVMVDRVATGAPAPADSFAIPDDVRTAFQNLPVRGLSDLTLGMSAGSRETDPTEIEAGIVFLPGPWNVTLVRQEDGVVVVEAPISARYTSDVFEEAARRMPDSPIVAAVSSSDAWPHVGGVREFVARGVPVYAHTLNVPLLRRMLEAPRTFQPDSLALARRDPELRVVEGAVTVGSGPNRFVLYPINGEGGERMVAVYFPEHRLLYASDLVQRMPDGSFFMPEYLHEVRLLVEREALDVETVFAMPTPPIPWREVLAALPESAM